ncbi:MAG: bis(5'-nucleosyl)-tetraphosphatase (symmetrical) YqeK [Lachnospiraceae bacterium]|nr:bis(5'-nucleosyl)-tetraphosphatase (symmetrical) YqeK [Lachnospiraceae bacterium]
MIRQNAYSVELSDFVPDAVAEYIISNNLYKSYIGSKRFTNAQILDDLQKSLKPSRYEHTLSVANTARELADTFGENPNKAYLAGLLHDCAKCIDDDQSIEMCKNNNIELSEFELNNPALVHAKLGAFLAQTKYHIIDEDIINAIAYHTTGRPDMSLLEKIIFVADYIEPLRTKQPYLSMLRECAFKDLDYTIYRISEDTLEYLKKTTENENQIDTNTKDTYLYYKNIVENR